MSDYIYVLSTIYVSITESQNPEATAFSNTMYL